MDAHEYSEDENVLLSRLDINLARTEDGMGVALEDQLLEDGNNYLPAEGPGINPLDEDASDNFDYSFANTNNMATLSLEDSKRLEKSSKQKISDSYRAKNTTTANNNTNILSDEALDRVTTTNHSNKGDPVDDSYAYDTNKKNKNKQRVDRLPSEPKLYFDGTKEKNKYSEPEIQSSQPKKAGPVQMVKKLLSGINSSGGDSSDKLTKQKRDEILKKVTVASLPQRFVCKYVGYKSCDGLWGSTYTRKPVDRLVRELRALEKNEDLPLINVKITEEGIKITTHPHSRSRKIVPDQGLLPLQFISYAAQDGKYSKLFAYILVREMSSRQRTTECHVYLCDGIVSARKMALSTSLAFKSLESKLSDEQYKFQVDLNMPADKKHRDRSGQEMKSDV